MDDHLAENNSSKLRSRKLHRDTKHQCCNLSNSAAMTKVQISKWLKINLYDTSDNQY